MPCLADNVTAPRSGRKLKIMNDEQKKIVRDNLTFISENVNIDKVVDEIQKINPKVFNAADNDRLQRRLPGEHKLAELIRILEVREYGFQLLYNGIRKLSGPTTVLGRLENGIEKKKTQNIADSVAVKGKPVITYNRPVRKSEISGAEIMEGMAQMFAAQRSQFKDDIAEIKADIQSDIGDAKQDLITKNDSLLSDIGILRKTLFDFRDKVDRNILLLSQQLVQFKETAEKDKDEMKALVEDLTKRFKEQQEEGKKEIEFLTNKLLKIEKQMGMAESIQNQSGEGNIAAIFNREGQIRKEIQDLKSNMRYYMQATNQKLNSLEQRMQKQETLSQENQAMSPIIHIIVQLQGAAKRDSDDSGTEDGAYGP
ncbi:uncharacterized protein LOC100367764 [Saccoglossus kowalevskii]